MYDPYDATNHDPLIIIVPYDPACSNAKSVVRQGLLLFTQLITENDPLAELRFWDLSNGMESNIFSSWSGYGFDIQPYLEKYLNTPDYGWEIDTFEKFEEGFSEQVNIHTSQGTKQLNVITPRHYRVLKLKRMDLVHLVGT